MAIRSGRQDASLPPRTRNGRVAHTSRLFLSLYLAVGCELSRRTSTTNFSFTIYTLANAPQGWIASLRSSYVHGLRHIYKRLMAQAAVSMGLILAQIEAALTAAAAKRRRTAIQQRAHGRKKTDARVPAVPATRRFARATRR